MDKYKKLAMIMCSVGLMFLLTGITYAYFNYTKVTESQNLVAGDIYFRLNEGNDEIELTNVFPESASEARSRNDNYITFSVNGINTSNKTIYYEFVLNYGETLASPKSRYNDKDLRFDLVELDANGNEVSYLVEEMGYSSIVDRRIWVDTVNSNTTTELVRYYKLRVWLDENVVISESDLNADYTTTDYPNKYATVKLMARGDFEEKELYPRLASMMRSNAVMDNINSDYVDNTTPGIIFSQAVSDTNGKGLYIRSGTENDTNPIVYYRGAVTDNNVLFADKCWKIVRTTDTGGVKLIYNGEYTLANKCNNSGTATLLKEGNTTAFKFNNLSNTIAIDGYMYGSTNGYSTGSPGNGAYYSNSFSWDGAKYQLSDDATTTLSDTKHYTCASSNKDEKCDTIRYYYANNKFVVVSNGRNISQQIEAIHTNTNNSLAKTKIDAWYVANLTSYTDKLEDTVWCNDRTYYDNTLWKDDSALTDMVYYAALYRSNNPSLTCSQNDSFTVDNAVGNKKLTYPVGMITSDELRLGGIDNISYLYSGSEYFTMTPGYFWNPFIYGYAMLNLDKIMNNTSGLRPMVSLKSTAKVLTGSGTIADPYVVD